MGAQSAAVLDEAVQALGCRWRLPAGNCIADAIRQHGAWEIDTTRAVLAHVRPGMHVLDVGANFGYFTLLLAKAVGRSGRVWAFEPVAEYRERLVAHLRSNGLEDRVTVLPYGLSERTATVPIAVGTASATMHWTGGDPPNRNETIELRALDDVAGELGLQRLDFVKLDLDGHEPQFLRGARRTLARYRPSLSVEFAQHCLHAAGDDVRGQARLLERAGYVLCDERTGLPYPSEMEFLVACGNFDRSANVQAMPVESLTGVRSRVVGDIAEFRTAFGLAQAGVLLEDDLDVVENDCERYQRKRRDAEVLCALAASTAGPCLDLGTSFGRSAFKLATNNGGQPVYTVNMLPEQTEGSGAQITHVLSRDDIGAYYRAHGVRNVEQFYANTLSWEIPERVRDLAVIFVDACHDEDAVFADSVKVWPRLRPGGFLVWHDFSPFFRGRHPWIDSVMRGVARFVREYGGNAEVVHLRGSWLGVLRKERL